jgi:hypothetical protein
MQPLILGALMNVMWIQLFYRNPCQARLVFIMMVLLAKRRHGQMNQLSVYHFFKTIRANMKTPVVCRTTSTVSAAWSCKIAIILSMSWKKVRQLEMLRKIHRNIFEMLENVVSISVSGSFYRRII